MKEETSLVIADDFPLFREGIRLLLGNTSDYVIKGEAANGNELVAMVEEFHPQVVITDIDMPEMNGIEATKEIKRVYPDTGVIALTMYGDDHLISDMIEAGANGYLLKSTGMEELQEAIGAARTGGSYFCNATTLRLTKLFAKIKQPKEKEAVQFSEKEKEIIQLICEQYASKQIAGMTQLTHRTVEKYRDRIMEKTGSRNVVGIVIYAIRHGLYQP